VRDAFGSHRTSLAPFHSSLHLTSFRTRTSGTSSLVETFLRSGVARQLGLSAAALAGLLVEAPGLPGGRACEGAAEAIFLGACILGLMEGESMPFTLNLSSRTRTVRYSYCVGQHYSFGRVAHFGAWLFVWGWRRTAGPQPLRAD